MDPGTGAIIAVTAVLVFGSGVMMGIAFGCCVVGMYALWLNRTRVPVAPGT